MDPTQFEELTSNKPKRSKTGYHRHRQNQSPKNLLIFPQNSKSSDSFDDEDEVPAWKRTAKAKKSIDKDEHQRPRFVSTEVNNFGFNNRSSRLQIPEQARSKRNSGHEKRSTNLSGRLSKPSRNSDFKKPREKPLESLANSSKQLPKAQNAKKIKNHGLEAAPVQKNGLMKNAAGSPVSPQDDTSSSGAPPKFDPKNPPAGLNLKNQRTVSIKRQMEEVMSDFDFDNSDHSESEKSKEEEKKEYIKFIIEHAELINMKKRVHAATGVMINVQPFAGNELNQSTRSSMFARESFMGSSQRSQSVRGKESVPDIDIEFSAVAQQLLENNEKVIFSKAYLSGKDNEFTVYFVKIDTMLGSWIVAYRYSQLAEFHKKFKDKYKKQTKFPHFPPKVYFKKNSPEVVNGRKVSIQEYLNDLTNFVDVLQDAQMCQFFEFPETTKQYLQDLSQRGNQQQIESQDYSTAMETFDYQQSAMKIPPNRMKSEITQGESFIEQGPLGQNLSPKSQLENSLMQSQKLAKEPTFIEMMDTFQCTAEDVIAHFFEKVHDHPNLKLHYLKQLDEFYFKERPRLNTVVLKQLIFGSLDQEVVSQRLIVGPAGQLFQDQQKQGLLIIMSDWRSNELAATQAAYIMQKMLDFQKNIHADTCAREFARATPEFMHIFGFENLLQQGFLSKSTKNQYKINIKPI